jgi:hypothetical protein
MMNVLALDLASKTGYAFNEGTTFRCGTWELASRATLSEQKKTRGDRRQDIRVVNLWGQLRKLYHEIRFDYVVFEDVQFSSSTLQTQLWASLRAAVWLSEFGGPPEYAPKFECVDVKTLKKFAGHGGATKEMMAAFLLRSDTRFCRIGKLNPKFFFRRNIDNLQEIDDNAVDAVWLWKWADVNLNKNNR